MNTSGCAKWLAAGAGSILMCAGSAWARPGPDVIVGELPDVSNFTSAGAISGKRAYSVGTTSCNIGTQELTWNANTNQHPVISQNLYRLSNGRFEQIGQAWLKHGFCALQGTVCSNACSPSPLGCGALGILCSDPYSSGLNGDQSGLGPKSEVNATTGAFPYPWINQGSGSGALFKRLQANDTDLTVAGALYFVGAMYVQPEDAMANNNDNNESYRRVTFAAGNRDISLQGSTQRERAGVLAWKDNGLGIGVPDPNVLVTNVDVASDGRFIVLSKATLVSGTRYHYEYAIENLNSHRSGQAFSVPLPAAANAGSAYFHDVDYHSGEPYALTDWTNAISASDISWATQTFAQNQNANALRWDTVYTFAFDADGNPGQGNASITLFRTGTPTSVSVNVMLPGGGPPPPPDNDLCANAIVVSNGGTSWSNVSATNDPQTNINCGSSVQIFNDIWFRYTAGCTGTVNMNLCGATFDTKLAVYPACPTANNTAIACNDDSNTCGTNSLQSALSFAGTAGTQYIVRVGAFTNGATGSGTLTIAGPSCGPAGDDCSSPVNIASYGGTPYNTIGATTDGPTPTTCGTGNLIANDIWFTYTACAAGAHTVNTCGATWDSVLVVYTGTCGALTQAACNDDAPSCGGNGLQSSVTWTGAVGTTYRIRLGGYQGAGGAGTLNLTGPSCTAAPPNDLCANATPITSYGATAFSNAGAGNDGPAPTTCGTGNLIGADIWYTYTACVAGSHTVDTCTGGNYDSVIVVYTGGCGALTQVVCNDDFGGCGANGLSSRATWTGAAGTTYRIRVGGYQSASGSGTLTLTGPACPPPAPANDNCNNRAGIALGATPFSTVGATTDGPAHAACLNAGSNQVTNDIWYNYPSQCNGTLTVDTCTGTNYDSKIAVYAYDGTCATINDSTLRACNDDACGASGLASRVAIAVSSGHNYAIRVGGFNGATGSGMLTLTCTPCPCEWNHDGVLNSQDFFDFLAAFFALNADFNNDGVTNSQDFFDFLTCFFAGCP